MGYQPRIRSPKRAIRTYRKAVREKVKNKTRFPKRKSEPTPPLAPSEQELSEATLRRLHTLGSQKFGSSPFSLHFDRWLLNVKSVLAEFEAYLGMVLDEQYIKERSQALSQIKLQLDNRRRREASLEKQINNLADAKNRLQQLNNEYAAKVTALKGQKNAAVNRLNKEISALKKEQDRIIRIKTGFFHGISKREREAQEIAVVQQLNDKQQELELLILNFREQHKRLREAFEHTREPVREEAKVFQKRVLALEDDGSLEERWFACEALSDAVNSFLQRKAAQRFNSSNTG
jgi:predicted  nucleic acid-binding Zn-ribbon protein